MNIERISKAKIQYLRKLSQKKYRLSEGKLLIEGSVVIREAVQYSWRLDMILCTAAFLEQKEGGKIIEIASKAKIPIFEFNKAELNELSDVVTSQGVIAVASWKISLLDSLMEGSTKGKTLVALDKISDPGNLGTIIRTCDWFGIDGLLLSKDSVEVTSPKVIRATMGSIFHFPVYSEVDLPNTLAQLKEKGLRIVACSGDAPKAINDYKPTFNQVLVFGSEAHGITPEVLKIANEKISVPRYGNAESLNVGVACGIVLAEVRK